MYWLRVLLLVCVLGFKCTTVAISVRDKDLFSFDRQGKLLQPTSVSDDIAEKAMELFEANYRWDKPIRSIGVRGAGLVTASRHIQLELFNECKVEKENFEKTIDKLRERFGHNAIQRCSMLFDPGLTGFDPKSDHTIHPVSYFR